MGTNAAVLKRFWRGSVSPIAADRAALKVARLVGSAIEAGFEYEPESEESVRAARS
jgi:hypothetical protein